FFPNALTVMNAMMGLMAVFFAVQGRVREASLFLLGAALFDKLDGALARRLGLTEPAPGSEHRSARVSMGGLLDDIADALSFCIAPAVSFFTLMSDTPDALMQRLPYGWVALAYAVAGIGRLVYFTLDTAPIPGFFKGMPTPAGALLVIAPMVIFSQVAGDAPEMERFWAVFSFGLMIATALMMNASPIRYLHIGRWMGRHPWLTRFNLLALMLSLLTPFYGHMLLIQMLLYTLSPFVTGRIDPQIAAQGKRPKAL
ncbi:MAG: CDP-alcohol phosphatidyltransferase, partial [Desulfobacteraceae bacterium]